MGIHATIYMIVKGLTIDVVAMLKYLPISLLYISSMVIGYKGLKYLEVSLSSPIQNTSGVITSLLLVLVFKEELPIPAYIAFALIFIGILFLSITEYSSYKKERNELKKNMVKNKVIFFTILFPLAYCVLDGLGTFLDSVYLDKLEIIEEDMSLLCYEYTFFIYAFITALYLKFKKETITIKKEKDKIVAAILETAGEFFYVFAIGENSTISASIVGSYCILSFLLGGIVLKEKLSKKQYIGIALAIIGIIVLSILDV
jgi:drug/metabolite transporter (DMT)-like permease